MADWYTPSGEVSAFPLFKTVEDTAGNSATWTPVDGQPVEIRGTLHQTMQWREYFVEDQVSAIDTPETFAVRTAEYSQNDFPAPTTTDTYGTLEVAGVTYTVQAVLPKQSYILLLLSTPQ